MKVWTRLSESDLYDIAQEIGVAIAIQQVSTEHWNGSGVHRSEIPRVGRAYSFGLRPLKTTRDEYGDYRYQRTSASVFHDERRVFAVCWHGHRDFMRAVFKRDPEARIKTALGRTRTDPGADYRGREDFEEKFPDTAYINVGSMMYPQYASEVCKCGGWA